MRREKRYFFVSLIILQMIGEKETLHNNNILLLSVLHSFFANIIVIIFSIRKIV